jgi:hypothetical protein
MWSLEISFGDRRAPENVFRFERVCLNLPGNEGYTPGRPWVFKQWKDGSIASDVHVYIDNLRQRDNQRWSVGLHLSGCHLYWAP